ncbi:hypothetical protein [Bacillus sp. REN10]|uniref:hypothetical protein n=1 Tax=Bacillus sp. REN10 TaxID=2782541 RepID=UPI00193C54F3|nr:hypothetical protein [Bacillus sp. REN10]
MRETKKETNKQKYLHFSMWFILLSTFGVGGGILFLLFAVVPIEQMYADRGWSQYKIDHIMKYYVIGWVMFGFIVSFLYYRYIVKMKRYKWAYTLLGSSILLCGMALYYFMNTGTGVIQSSQGEIEKGERFTFGPYPEKNDMKALKEEGYDGIITLLNPTLPIEKPLLDKEKKNAKEIGIELHSIPMLPWVGNNSDSIKEAKTLIKQDDKQYYVHCYLGRHRVDVIKQVINQELDQTYKVHFMQPTTFERGNLYHARHQNILLGPFPTDEEWFTRIKRAEVKEVVSLLRANHSKWLDQEKQVTKEMQIQFSHFPLSQHPSIDEIKKVGDYLLSRKEKVFVHNFNDPVPIDQLHAYVSWGKFLPFIEQNASVRTIGARIMIGYSPSASEQNRLATNGVESFISIQSNMSTSNLYQQALNVIQTKKLTYMAVPDEITMNRLDKIITGLLLGSANGNSNLRELTLTNGKTIFLDRNMVIGPMLMKEEYESFALTNGVSRLIFLYSPSITSESEMKEVTNLTKQYGIALDIIPMYPGYEEKLIPALNKENGLNYIMTAPELIPHVNEFLDHF